MTYPKVGFLWPTKGLGAQKKILGPPKNEKNYSQKTTNSVICPNMGGGQSSCPRHPDGVAPLVPVTFVTSCMLPFTVKLEPTNK